MTLKNKAFENIVAKGEIPFATIFSFSHDVFCPTKGKFHVFTLYHTIPTVDDMEKRPFKNSVGKGEIAGNQHFLLFLQCFLPIPKQISIFE